MGLEVRKNLLKQVNAASEDPAVDAIVITGSTHSPFFSAGADITEFKSGQLESPSLHDLIDAVEGIDKPTVAAFNGVALGGGLELALACKYRISAPKARVGLPEVHLGLIPGAGGTQRLPRATQDLAFSLDMITSGRMVKAEDALKASLLDGISEPGENFEDYFKR